MTDPFAVTSVTSVTSGRVLISGSAAFLLCLFLSPKFIEFLAQPRVRAEHPRGGPGGA